MAAQPALAGLARKPSREHWGSLARALTHSGSARSLLGLEGVAQQSASAPAAGKDAGHSVAVAAGSSSSQSTQPPSGAGVNPATLPLRERLDDLSHTLTHTHTEVSDAFTLLETQLSTYEQGRRRIAAALRHRIQTLYSDAHTAGQRRDRDIIAREVAQIGDKLRADTTENVALAPLREKAEAMLRVDRFAWLKSVANVAYRLWGQVVLRFVLGLLWLMPFLVRWIRLPPVILQHHFPNHAVLGRQHLAHAQSANVQDPGVQAGQGHANGAAATTQVSGLAQALQTLSMLRNPVTVAPVLDTDSPGLTALGAAALPGSVVERSLPSLATVRAHPSSAGSAGFPVPLPEPSVLGARIGAARADRSGAAVVPPPAVRRERASSGSYSLGVALASLQAGNAGGAAGSTRFSRRATSGGTSTEMDLASTGGT